MERSTQVGGRRASRRTEEVGRALDRIDEAVKTVAAVSEEIDACAGEQSVGSEQIGQAISS